MNSLEAILSRRSIRHYQDKPIADEIIEQLIRLAMSAPSAHNEKPWHFVVITDRSILDAIPEIHPYAKMLLEAPAAVCVCGDHQLENDNSADYWVQDCAAATMNILTGATALELGSCWLGIHPRTQRKEALAKMLNLPDHVEPFCLIALGYSAEQKSPNDSYHPQRIHRDKW